MNKESTLALFIGFGAGVAIGVLCAPQSAIDLRRTVVRKTKRGAHAINEQATELWDSASEAVESGRSAVAHAQEAGAKAFQKLTT